MTKMNKSKFYDLVNIELENKTLEELLEEFDLSPDEILWFLYTSGLLDEEILEKCNAYI